MSRPARLRPASRILTTPRFTLVFQAILTSIALGCGGSETSGSATTTTTTTSTTAADPSYAGTLDLEIRGTAEITLDRTTGLGTNVALTLNGAAAPHLLEDGTKLEGPGRFETLPEAGSELFVAKLSLPTDPAGPCGATPRAVALSLHHKKGAPHFGGGLTVYCGTEHTGVPARVFRLSGTLDPK